MMNIAALKELATQVAEVRPAWDEPQVLNVLLGLRDRDLEQLQVAALRAATDLKAKTPTAIGFAQYWVEQPTRPTTVSSYGTPEPLPECLRCGQPASRALSERLEICPDCGEAWEPIVFRPDAGRAKREAVPANAAVRAACNELDYTAEELQPGWQW
jgi:hypothetical protein